MSDVRVLVVDDQEPFRRAMAAVVEATDGFVVVGSVDSGEDSLTAVAEGLTDLSVPLSQLAAYVAAAVVAGVLAAAWPARRATRMDILGAIAHD